MGYVLQLAPMIQVLASGGEGAEPGIADPLLSHWLWTWIIFGLVFLVLKKFAFKPIREQLEARENRIRETIDKAQEVKAEAEMLLDKHREQMDRAKADAQEIINQGRDAAESAKSAIIEAGQQEARASVDRAGAKSTRRRRRPWTRSGARRSTSRSWPRRRCSVGPFRTTTTAG